MGPYGGGQAELLRVPFGDHNALRLGEDAEEKENDYVMLSDIFPTGYHATEMAGVIPGDSVVIAGAGPVGLMAALSAMIKGAAKVMVVDRHPDRLALAEQIGAIAIDDSKVDPVQAVLDETMGLGADRRVYLVVFIDALVVEVRDGQVRNKPFYLAVGVTVNGERDILGIWAGDGGDGAKFWLGVLTEIKNRGAEDVCIVVCDGLKGLPDAGRGSRRSHSRRRSFAGQVGSTAHVSGGVRSD
ncbi:glutathione-independent formaldehyde dehydrogenase [Microcella alkaliphila]|jgi:hypothetical protein|uniref:Glutathione-independent formaldehyde dehydrogenase n=1 Tax=Microcella alkaliphila TaxID=279828 RepID=A0A0U5BK63_9MICO|nr:glutathione-independent formaldehyde dehydrogenase [Microcella alkaliphila]